MPTWEEVDEAIGQAYEAGDNRARRRIRRAIAPHLKNLTHEMGGLCDGKGCVECVAIKAIDRATRAPSSMEGS